jgi:hypothetical protein
VGAINRDVREIFAADLLDAAIAASLQARREKLVRRVRNQNIRLLIALGLAGCVAVALA